MRSLFFVQARESHGLESGQQQSAGPVELVWISQPHQVDEPLQFLYLLVGQYGRRLAWNRDRLLSRYLGQDAGWLVLLEIDVDQHRIFGLELLLLGHPLRD